MDELESIEQLRGIICDVNVAELSDNIQWCEARVSPAWVDSWQKAADRALDEIEREVADRYIELPLDADGMRVEIGDRLREHEDGHEFTVDGLKIWGSDRAWWAYQENGVQAPVHRCTHTKPRTLEDVLHDFWEEWESHPIDTEWGVRLKRLRESEAKYAEEIRELMEVAE